MKKYLPLLALIIFIISSSNVVIAQTKADNMLEQINSYRSIEKEKTYLHLNRSLLFKGDQLGFTAYLINETNHTPVTSNFNLYLQITNADKKVIIQEMYPVENGITTGIIEIDSTYNPGQYTVTAYSKYMKEFEEPYHFTENFQVIDARSPEAISRNKSDKIDVQFLPESGHFLSEVINNVGVIAKDHLGYGLSNAKVMIKNNSGELKGVVNLNEFGIGKFAFLPEANSEYSAELNYNNEIISVEFKPEVQREGIIFSTSEKDYNLEILVKTNEQTLNRLSSDLSLIIQGKESLLNFEIGFNQHKNVAVRVPLNDLDPGINIITLFNDREQPVAERLVFNFEGFDYITPQRIQSRVVGDSLQLKIPFREDIKGKLSISILPQKTLSYNRNHNIISHFQLKPYLKGNIENAGWYFADLSAKKKDELDKLLITQGWSSYNWERVFIKESNNFSGSQDQFSFKAQILPRDQNRKNLRYMLHGSGSNGPQVFEIPAEVDSFIYEEFIPYYGENLKISRIGPNGQLVPASLNIEFAPNSFPDTPVLQNTLPYRLQGEKKDISQNLYHYELLNNDAELLDEVKLFGKTRQTPKERERELSHHLGVTDKVSVITLDDVLSYLTLAQFLQSKGEDVINTPGHFIVNGIMPSRKQVDYDVNSSTFGRHVSDGSDDHSSLLENNGAAIYLDDLQILDTNMFYNYSMMYIDYIVIGDGGIKIYTKWDSHYDNKDRNRIQEVQIPLTYAKDRKFYVPKYVSTSNNFFQDFGVIDWKPLIKFDNLNTASLIIKNPEVDFQLIIEGVTNEGNLIHSIQRLSPASN